MEAIAIGVQEDTEVRSLVLNLCRQKNAPGMPLAALRVQQGSQLCRCSPMPGGAQW
jgi:hypothetical protein